MPIVGTPFFRKMFFSRICFGQPFSDFWRYVSIWNPCDDEVQFTIFIGTYLQGAKKICLLRVEITATSPNSDKLKDLEIYLNAFTQLCILHNFDTFLLNKQNWSNSYFDIGVRYPYTIFPRARGKHKQPFTFWCCFHNYYPWNDIAEIEGVEPNVHGRTFFWAFDGSDQDYVTWA